MKTKLRNCAKRCIGFAIRAHWHVYLLREKEEKGMGTRGQRLDGRSVGQEIKQNFGFPGCPSQ